MGPMFYLVQSHGALRLRRRLEREGNRHVKQVSAHFCSRTLPARGFSLPPRAASYLPAQETRDQHKHKDNEGGQ